MKKLLTIGTLIAMSMGTLIGCSNESANPTDNTTEGNEVDSSETREPVDLKLWLDEEDYAEPLLEALAVALPHINITWEEVGTVDTLEKLLLDGPAGLGADIILIPHDHMADGVNQNAFVPLGSELSEMMEGRIPNDALGTVSHNDTYYGVPLATESVALFYNKTLLDELELEVATTFEEILEQAEKFNNPRDNEFILLFEGGNPYHGHIFLTSYGYELFGPNHDDADLISLDSSEVVQGLEFLEKVSEILPVPSGDLDWDTTHGRFVDGEAPYMISGPWSISDMHEYADFEWGITTIPTINGTQPQTFAGYTIAIISSYTDEADAAREVLDFMASDEGIQIIYEGRGSIPALVDSTIIPGVSEDPYSLGVLAQAEHAHPMPLIPEMSSYWAAAGPMFEAVWDGLLTPEEAAAKAEADFYASLHMQQ